MQPDWYALDHLPPGPAHGIRWRWSGYDVAGAATLDPQGNRYFFEVRLRELVPLPELPQAWRPTDAARWRWPDGRAPQPLPRPAEPKAPIVEDEPETTPRSPDKGQWWRDITRVVYEPYGSVGLEHGEARIMRHLILERSLPLDIKRQKSNAQVLVDLKKSWADVYGEQSAGDDWIPPLVPQPEDHRDFETVLGWFAEVAPTGREMFILRARMTAPPVTWLQIGNEIERDWTRARDYYKRSIRDLVAAANRPRRRAMARIAEVQARNREARMRGL